MSLDKAIQHGKEHRRRYYKSKAFDASCRPGGDCPYCRNNRLHSKKIRQQAAEEQIRDFHQPNALTAKTLSDSEKGIDLHRASSVDELFETMSETEHSKQWDNTGMGMSAHQSARSKSTTWLTPPDWIKRLGPFDTDPCCPPVMPWRTATQMYDTRGLERQWKGMVWLNPPFGRESTHWMKKMREHNNGIALLAARTETAMFFNSVWPFASAILFVRKRPHFYDANGQRAPFNSGVPIVLISYGKEARKRLSKNKDLGKYISLTGKSSLCTSGGESA